MSIEIRNVSFTYEGGSEGGVRDISLSVKTGEFVVLAGQSGCGKSTVTRLINATIPYFYHGQMTGDVLINGKNIKQYQRYELSNVVGSVFQNPRTQFFNTDTDSEIAFGLENMAVEYDTIIKRMEEVTAKLDIKDLRDRDIFKLSGGEKQKIAFASVYAMNPDIYVLDEPSSNLDKEGIEDLRRCLKLIKDEGRTVVVAEHRLYYLSDLADRVIYIQDGQISSGYSYEELRSFTQDHLDCMGLRSVIYTPLTITDSGKNEETAPSDSGLRLKDVTIKRRKNVILPDLDITFAKGEVTGIVGRNGAGKSTLLRTLAGLHKDYTGRIMLDGKEIRAGWLCKHAYLVMQDVNYQLFAESVEAECLLGNTGITERDVDEALETTDLISFKQRHPNTLSGGQKQRLSVTVSSIGNREIILFDEPTSGLDGKNMCRIARIIKDLANAGKYVVVVSHDHEFLNRCSDKIINIRRGIS